MLTLVSVSKNVFFELIYTTQNSGHPPPIYYVSAAPLEVMHGPPRFPSHPTPKVISNLTPELVALRSNIVKQIEYYFRLV